MKSTANVFHADPMPAPSRRRSTMTVCRKGRSENLNGRDRGVGAIQPVASCPDPATPVMTLGQLRITRLVVQAAPPVGDRLIGLLFMPEDRRLMRYDGTVLPVRAGDLVTVPIGGSLRDMGGRVLTCTAVIGPREALGAMPSRTNVTVLPRSGSIDALRHHVERLQAMAGEPLDANQMQAAARSIRELLAAIMVPFASQRRCGAWREEALLERILKHVDTALGTEVDVAQLCEALGCSRSALYRAVAPQGGLVRLVTQQRLLAAHIVLSEPDDQRSIAQIARAHGFSNASQFSRCFRRTFGLSAGGVRRASILGKAC